MAQLHEYQGKKILAAHGIEIPAGNVARTAAEVREIARKIGKPVVVKAQTHSTSRAASGGIKFADNAEEAFEKAEEIFAQIKPEMILVDEKLDIEREFYLGFIIDDRLKRPTLLFSGSGGSGIEERADTMQKLVCSIRKEPTIEEIVDFVQSNAFMREKPPRFAGGFTAEAVTLNIAELLLKLYRTAKSCEARTAEINPLALLEDGRLVALDARISVDDYAVFRHEDLQIEMARELGHTPTKLEKIAWEIEKNDFRGTFYFVEILYNQEIPNPKSQIRIGFHGAGGGGSMASLDAAQRNSLSPACYVDTSGNPPASKVYRAAKIILSIPYIKGYFLSGSGVASQEQFGLARAVIKAFREIRPNIPAVLRLGGNGEDYAKELVEKYSKDLPAPLEAYQKQHSADFCAKRLYDLIVQNPTSNVQRQWEFQISNFKLQTENLSEISNVQSEIDEGRRTKDEKQFYKFKTRTGEITFDHAVFAEKDAAPIVEACPVKILKLDERGLPVLAIEREEAERGKCIECLACEFASWEYETGGVKIDLPIKGI